MYNRKEKNKGNTRLVTTIKVKVIGRNKKTIYAAAMGILRLNVTESLEILDTRISRSLGVTKKLVRLRSVLLMLKIVLLGAEELV